MVIPKQTQASAMREQTQVLFKKHLRAKIMNGEKTHTRRTVERKRGRRVYSVGEKVGVRAGYTKPVAYVIIKKRFEQATQ